MLLNIRGLQVLFPYDFIYPEQYAYMCDIKQSIDVKGPCLLEMPSGTGKTVSLLSLIVAYILNSNEKRKLIYCSRTVPEIEKALMELKRLMEYREKVLGKKEEFLGLGLTSRKNLCTHPDVSQEKRGKVVDARCRSLTASWVRQRAQSESTNVPLCDFFEGLENADESTVMPCGVYTLEDLKNFGKQKTFCPYYLARRMITFSNVIIYSYHYLLDPKVADLVSKEMSKDCIVVFDEAHNIDNVCIESMSVDITRPILEASSRSINVLSEKIDRIKETDAEKLRNEYSRLVEGLRETSQSRAEDQFMTNPVLPDDILQEAVPGNIRRAEHFIAFLRRFVEYLKTRLRVMHVVAESPISFLQHLKDVTYIEKKPLQFCAERLASLTRTLELTDIDEFSSLQKVATFATICATYAQGFLLILEPFENDNARIHNPVLHLSCLDASLAIKPVFTRFSTVIITSGTLSPLEMYPQMLQFRPSISKTYPMTLTRNCFCPLVITRGSDQVAISSKFEVRNDPAVVRNFGSVLIELAKIVPDGVVCFFPSYLYMESIVSMWNEMGILNDVWKNKLIFVETPDAAETSVALENYRAARLAYLRDNYHIRENDFLTFDALRHAAQCVGRVLRGKSDYGLMIFADKRYSRSDKRNKLPQWMSAGFNEATINLSTDMAMVISKKFLRSMAQPFDPLSQLGVALWNEDDVKKREKRLKIVAQEGEKEKENVELDLNLNLDLEMDSEMTAMEVQSHGKIPE
ncbi:hypothetical protein BKA69DRAFT_1085762 [Paraphysoderma sedebokerense]|nr:hypothetical protein BKA69DRAFT_1085762 [Paraphysoderma sedebokerense]